MSCHRRRDALDIWRRRSRCSRGW